MIYKNFKLSEGSKFELKEILPSGIKIERTAIAISNAADREIYIDIIKIPRENAGFPEIELQINEPGRAFQIQFIKKYHKSTYEQNQVGTKRPRRIYPTNTPQTPHKYIKNNPHASRALQFCIGYRLRNESQDIEGLVGRELFRKPILIPLIEKLLLKMSLPDKTNSHNQRYFITEKGKRGVT